MRYFKREGVQPATGLEALREQYGNEDLSRLARNYCTPKPPTRKDDMLALLAGRLEPESLRATWPALDPLIQAALAETAWSDDGVFDRDRFEAKYGRLPPQDKPAPEPPPGTSEYQAQRLRSRGAGILELLAPWDVMGRDVQKRLRAFVPEPAPPQVRVTDPLPDHVERTTSRWNPETRSLEEGAEFIPLARRDMERAAAHDLGAALRAADAGKVAVTDKNRWPTPGATRAMGRILDGGDYYPAEAPKPTGSKGRKGAGDGAGGGDEDGDEDEGDNGRAPGPIRAFAWPLLLLAGRLAQVSGGRLALTRAGRAALTAPPHETLRSLWQAWLGTDLLDEMRRVNAIRGQTGKGRRGMTDPAGRRDGVAAALAECPAGRWVAVEDFARHVRAAGHDFQVSRTPWTLYLVDPHYGTLESADAWQTLQFRFILCFLMEYAGTLGLLDLAWVPPAWARHDFGDNWGAEEMSYLGRYDGLFYFRVNPLGAFCLGAAEGYAPPPAEARRILDVGPGLEVRAAGELSPSDRMTLDAFAAPAGDGAWRLDRDKALAAAAGGREVREFAGFLEASAGGEPLPGPAAEFLEDVEDRLRAFADLGQARVVGCNDPGLAAFVAGEPTTAKLCHRLNENLLVVPAKTEAAFFRALLKLGYVVRDGAEPPDPPGG